MFVSRSLHFTSLEWYFDLLCMCMCGSLLGGSVIQCISVFGIVLCSRIGLELVSFLSFEHAVSEFGMVVPFDFMESFRDHWCFGIRVCMPLTFQAV